MVTRHPLLWRTQSYRQVTNFDPNNLRNSEIPKVYPQNSRMLSTLKSSTSTASASSNRSDQSWVEPTREALISDWPASQDLWIFGYASLIWRTEFEVLERHLTLVQGWHRALKMWSRVNRGSPECPGLVFALLSGGSCKGLVFRTPAHQVKQTIENLWFREMPNNVYQPRWLQCPTPHGTVNALAFTLPRSSPSYTNELSPAQYQHIFQNSAGRYGTTLDYAKETFNSLKQHGIHDKALEALLQHAKDPT